MFYSAMRPVFAAMKILLLLVQLQFKVCYLVTVRCLHCLNYLPAAKTAVKKLTLNIIIL